MELGVSKLRGYREFVSARDIVTVYNVYCSPKNFILKAFPPALALASHQPFFSIEMFESWVSPSGYELYETWLENSANIVVSSLS